MTEKNLAFAFLAALSTVNYARATKDCQYHLACAVLVNGRCASIGTNTPMFHAEVNALLNLPFPLDGKDRCRYHCIENAC